MSENEDLSIRLSKAWEEVMGKEARTKIQRVWQKIKKGKPLQGEEERLGKILQEHPEYHSFWESPLSSSQTQKDNPYLHIYLHIAVENQIAEEDPRQVNLFYRRKIAQGENRHRAIHQIVEVLREVLFEALRYRKPLDRAKYIEKLRELQGG